MIRALRIGIAVMVALLLQVTILPAYLQDPYQPNLLIIFVVWLGLRETVPAGWALAFFSGLLLDCFSGIYLGLEGFTSLFVYLVLKMLADYLYTDSRYLLILAVFLATVATGIFQLVLLGLFAAAEGIYASLLPALLPQALVNALVASLLAGVIPVSPVEENA
jgi:rod shape-determining protein MreD